MKSRVETLYASLDHMETDTQYLLILSTMVGRMVMHTCQISRLRYYTPCLGIILYRVCIGIEENVRQVTFLPSFLHLTRSSSNSSRTNLGPKAVMLRAAPRIQLQVVLCFWRAVISRNGGGEVWRGLSTGASWWPAVAAFASRSVSILLHIVDFIKVATRTHPPTLCSITGIKLVGTTGSSPISHSPASTFLVLVEMSDNWTGCIYTITYYYIAVGKHDQLRNYHPFLVLIECPMTTHHLYEVEVQLTIGERLSNQVQIMLLRIKYENKWLLVILCRHTYLIIDKLSVGIYTYTDLISRIDQSVWNSVYIFSLQRMIMGFITSAESITIHKIHIS